MMYRRRLVGVLAWLLIATTPVFLAIPVEAQGEEDRLDEVEQEIRDLQRDIEEAEAEASEYAEQLAETQKRMDALLEILDEAERALSVINSAVESQEEEIAELQRKVKILQAQIAETLLDQRSTRTQIRDRAVDLYMNGSVALGGLVFGVEDMHSATVSIEYAGNLVQDTGILLRSLEVLEQQEEAQKRRLLADQASEEEVLAALDADRQIAAANQATVEESRAEIQVELDAQEALLAEINAEIAEHENHVHKLESESRELEREIARRQVREGSAPGRLAYPVSGAVSSPFGWRIHPIFGTRKLHTGIDLSASSGTNIRAAGNGTVILASTWGGYGRTVIIDHGGGLSSLYAHQSSIRVSLGQEVLAGDVIGLVGCSGYCTGAHLHFETREFGTPVDPMKYLKG